MVETYLAVAKALKAVVPRAAFGPSNMAGISGDVDAGAGGGGGTEVCTSCGEDPNVDCTERNHLYSDAQLVC